jgi:acyl-CoA thioester hydrolase
LIDPFFLFGDIYPYPKNAAHKMKKHKTEHRVSYKETDQMKVVYYSNYLVWFEIGRTEFFRDSGLNYKKIEEEDKIYLPVIEAECSYRAPVKYDDLVTVETELAGIEGTRVIFEYKITVDGQIKATGRTRHVFVNEKAKPIPVPDKIRKALV